MFFFVVVLLFFVIPFIKVELLEVVDRPFEDTLEGFFAKLLKLSGAHLVTVSELLTLEAPAGSPEIVIGEVSR